MPKDPNDVKVLALNVKSTKRSKGEKDTQDYGAPGNNTPEEVRSAQRNLLACAMDANEVHYHTLNGEVLLDSVSDTFQDVMSMITPNTAYVTEVDTRFEHSRAIPSKDPKKDERYSKHRKKLGYEE